MKDKLITLIIIVVFGVCLFWAAPKINAWAAVEGSHTIECEAGAQVIQLPEGRIRVIGVCSRIPGNELDEPVYNYPYPVPDQPYPYIDNPCDRDWTFGETCLP